MLEIGIIGAGYWGSNYVRSFTELPGAEVTWVADLDEQRLADITARYSHIKTTTDYADLRDDPTVDAVCVATPPSTHYEIATELIEHDKHVLVEKPFTLDSDNAWELEELSKEREKQILVGHIFEYNNAVRRLKQEIETDNLGQLFYLHSERTGLGPIREHVSVLWDLAPHDVSTFMYLLDEKPTSVRCIGRSYLQEVPDSALIFMEFEDTTGFIHCSWLHPHKSRKVTAVGDEKMAVFSDTSPEEILQLYENRVNREENTRELGEFYYTVKEGDAVIPYVDQREPLKLQIEHFISCINENREPLTSATEGAEVVEVIEAMEKSMQNDGEIIELDW